MPFGPSPTLVPTSSKSQCRFGPATLLVHTTDTGAGIERDHPLGGGGLEVPVVAVGQGEHHVVQARQVAARGPDPAAAVVQDRPLGVDVRLVDPDRGPRLEAGVHDVAPLARLAVGARPDVDVPVHHDGRGEDPGGIGGRARGLLGHPVVDVLPVELPGVGVDGVEGVAATDDDQVRPAAGAGLVPGGRGDQAAVGVVGPRAAGRGRGSPRSASPAGTTSATSRWPRRRRRTWCPTTRSRPRRRPRWGWRSPRPRWGRTTPSGASRPSRG